MSGSENLDFPAETHLIFQKSADFLKSLLTF
jgi:hypothetical protein